MILSTQPSYPSTRSYVLKLHRDAAPLDGKLIGRLENVVTGAQFDFGSGVELLALLERDPSPNVIEEP
jgi:hypothetical protein